MTEESKSGKRETIVFLRQVPGFVETSPDKQDELNINDLYLESTPVYVIKIMTIL